MSSRSVIALIVAILICQAAGGIGSVFTAQSVSTWYPALEKPSLTPPGWLFGPVWITLYTLMGIAIWLVWKQGTEEPAVKLAIGLFIVQLVLNALWSFLFFGLRQPGTAFVEINLLLLAIIVATYFMAKVQPWAGALMVPYILWVSFATWLNYQLWQLN